MGVIGIRREDKSEWERRVPLTPDAVATLVRAGVSVVVQPSPIRVFPDGAYREAGATVAEDLSGCDVVVAVKEIPVSLFRDGGAYVFFSHTIKGQPYNMPMLRTLIERGCSLFDYERVADERGRRLVFFGRHAGLAGMIDTLWAAGRRLEARGVETPLSDLRPAHAYADLAEAEEAVAAVGRRVVTEGLPTELAPFVCGFTGYGNVSRGAQHILGLLPVEEVAPADLAALSHRQDAPRDRVFKVVFREEDLFEPTAEGARFELQDYYDHPGGYRSIFAERHAPHLSLLINGIYWTEAYPRLLTRVDLARLVGEGSPDKLVAVGDISCDIDGSLACTVASTLPGEPVYVYDPATGDRRFGFEGPGVAVMAVDILPCELPREASESFSAALMPFIVALVGVDLGAPFEELALPGPMKRALVLQRGEFTPDFEYMRAFLEP